MKPIFGLILIYIILSESALMASSLKPIENAPALQQLASILSLEITDRFKSMDISKPTVAVVVEVEQSIHGYRSWIVQEVERLLLYRLNDKLNVKIVYDADNGNNGKLDRAYTRGADWLLHCVLGVRHETIYITADLTPLPKHFWQRLVDSTSKGVKEHFFVSASIDEEVRTVLSKLSMRSSHGDYGFLPVLVVPRHVLDVGIGDLDGDGEQELILLHELGLEAYSLRENPPRRLTVYDFSHIPQAEYRLRDPQGSLVVFDFNADGRSELFIRILDRRFSEILSWSGERLVSLREIDQVALCVYRQAGRPMIVYGEPEAGTNRFLAKLEIADVNQSVGRKLNLPRPFYDLRCIQTNNKDAPWISFVDDEGNYYQIHDGSEPRVVLRGVGDGFDLADLDGDGHHELIVSDAVWPGQPDRIRVFSDQEVIWEIKDIPGSVVAIAGQAIEDNNNNRVVVVVLDPSETISKIYLLQKK